MEEKTTKKIRLGAFVLIATVFLILGLYFIGSKRNIFGAKIHVSALFNNISGLIPGNSVQYNGINVGTVSGLEAISDTAIRVEFTIDKDMAKFITQNAIASIGTEGLLGNKLVNISPGLTGGLPLKEGTVMQSENPINTDIALRKLMSTNDNIGVIGANLKLMSDKFVAPGSVLNLLTDSAVSGNVKSAMENFNQAGKNSAVLTNDLSHIVKGVLDGKGNVGSLLKDTMMSYKLKKTISGFYALSDSLLIIANNLKQVSENINNKKGALGTLISDSVFARNLSKSMENIKNGSESFDTDMKALQYSWPFKKGIKKLK